jgi:hypothetical protein
MTDQIIQHHKLHETYDEDYCWQFNIRKKRLFLDMQEDGITESQRSNMRVCDFVFEFVDKSDKTKCKEIVKFIEKHEWLGKMPNRPTHRFTARFNDKLAGVVIMTVPNTFSKILGSGTEKLEKLISRGACISWSPKNLGSWLITKSIKYMVLNTEFRIFSAYSDTEAKELGSIYQACSFIYLGKKSGTHKQYLDPRNEKIGWFNDRHFRHKSMYKKHAATLNILNWEKYMKEYSPDWDKIPSQMAHDIKEEIKKYKASCRERTALQKHKYICIKGINKNETKKLLKLFYNNGGMSLPYPKIRGE